MQRYQHQFGALGSQAQFTLVGDLLQQEADNIMRGLEEQTTAFEYRFSRFRDDSELTHVNSHAGEKVAISLEFHALIQEAKQMATQTGGLYNPFILPALQKAGYVGSWPEPASVQKATDFRDRKPVPIEVLELGENWLLIPPEAALDFGGIGKGYLLDQLADSLQHDALDGFWLSLGGDIILQGHDIEGRNWEVGVQSAADPAAVITTIKFGTDRQAVATSGTTKRRGQNAGGSDWHHIIDPRNGKPAYTTILTATVTAPSAQLADIYAKCVVIGGEQMAAAWYEQGLIRTYYLQTEDELPVIRAPKEGAL